MDTTTRQYDERFLHWVWKSLQVDFRGLKTVCGKAVSVRNEGRLNSTDGPDFIDARLQIGNLLWQGDIEIHWSISDWRAHGHHTDPRYNKVILHLVFNEPGNQKIYRQDGTMPFTLHLSRYLPPNLNKLLSSFHRTDFLPCAGSINYISKEAVIKQFDKAHREYFEHKTDSLIELYDPDLPPGIAWKKLLTLALFDGLGISHNRKPMLTLGRLLHPKLKRTSSLHELENQALEIADFEQESSSSPVLVWNHKGCRPNNHPELRLRQAVILMWEIQQITLKSLLNQVPKSSWSNLTGSVQTQHRIGRERDDILYGIVFLPALYLLGNLFHSKKLREWAFEEWRTHQAQIPSSLLSLYARSDIPKHLYQNKLGAVYQMEHYCKSRRCDQCKVLKGIISP